MQTITHHTADIKISNKKEFFNLEKTSETLSTWFACDIFSIFKPTYLENFFFYKMIYTINENLK